MATKLCRVAIGSPCRPLRRAPLRLAQTVAPFRLPHRPAGLVALAAVSDAVEEAEVEGSEDIPMEDSAETCYPASVEVDNSNEDFSSIHLEIKDFPGVLRIVAWVLNGLDVRVDHASLETNEDGVALDTFQLTDMQAKPLSDDKLDLVADTLQQYMQYCAPNETEMETDEFFAQNVYISNLEDDVTEVLVYGIDKPGFLLELASVITGVGCTINQAEIRSCREYNPPAAFDYVSCDQGRIFRFKVTDQSGRKLMYGRCTSIMYVLSLVMGGGKAPTTPPGRTYKGY